MWRKRTARGWLWSAGAAVVMTMPLLVAFGCATNEPITSGQAEAAASQKYALEEVKRRAAQLEAGMSKAEVLVLLGSPAQQEGARWIYLPTRAGLLVPSEALVVRFVDGRYVSRATEPIVLGERLGE